MVASVSPHVAIFLHPAAMPRVLGPTKQAGGTVAEVEKVEKVVAPVGFGLGNWRRGDLSIRPKRRETGFSLTGFFC